MSSENHTPLVPRGSKVIVVGAGFAGLAAAQDLRKCYEVTVLEARGRIGGRVHDDHSWGFPLDLGAAWLHGGPENPLKALADKEDIATRETDYLNTRLFDGSLQFGPRDVKAWIIEYWLALFCLLPKLRASVRCDFVGALDLAAHSFPPGKHKVAMRAARNMVESQTAASSRGLSFLVAEGPGEFPPEGERVVTGGMASFLPILAAGLNIHRNEVVRQVQYGSGSVSVRTERDTYRAAAAVVTIPLGVLKKKTVTFVPELPREHQAAIDRLEMGIFNKVILEFDKVAWPPDCDFLGIATDDPSIPFFLNLNAYVRRPVLVGLAGGRFGRQIEERTNREIVAAALADLGSVLEKPAPAPIRYQITRWGSDKFAHGSYSTLLPAANGKEADDLVRPIENCLFFAGEATHPVDHSTVHGAYLSGRRAAAQIAGKAAPRD